MPIDGDASRGDECLNPWRDRRLEIATEPRGDSADAHAVAPAIAAQNDGPACPACQDGQERFSAGTGQHYDRRAGMIQRSFDAVVGNFNRVRFDAQTQAHLGRPACEPVATVGSRRRRWERRSGKRAQATRAREQIHGSAKFG